MAKPLRYVYKIEVEVEVRGGAAVPKAMSYHIENERGEYQAPWLWPNPADLVLSLMGEEKTTP